MFFGDRLDFLKLKQRLKILIKFIFIQEVENKWQIKQVFACNPRLDQD
jgi:hypothetical protein